MSVHFESQCFRKLRVSNESQNRKVYVVLCRNFRQKYRHYERLSTTTLRHYHVNYTQTMKRSLYITYNKTRVWAVQEHFYDNNFACLLWHVARMLRAWPLSVCLSVTLVNCELNIHTRVVQKQLHCLYKTMHKVKAKSIGETSKGLSSKRPRPDRIGRRLPACQSWPGS